MKERDIRPEGLFETFHRLNAEDVAQYLPAGERLEPHPCPGCGCDDFEELYVANSFPVVRCIDCASIYVTPRPTEEALSEFYRDGASQQYLADTWYPTTIAARSEKIFRPRVADIRSLLDRHGISAERIIDVGAGAGMLLDECRAVGLGGALCAVEPHATFAGICREKGYEVFEGFAAAAAEDPAWAGQASLVTAFEVFEHVLSPPDFVADLAALTRPGGFVIFTGVHGAGFDILTLGRQANAVCPPHHLNFLSREGISRLLRRCGLEEIAFLTPGVLDVDIVRNRLQEQPDIEIDPFIRHVLMTGDDDTLTELQRFITDRLLSSHMWIVARRPVQ